MNPKSLAALTLGKTIQTILKTSGRGATTAPGYYSLKLDKNLLKKLASGLEKIIVITGTNGKTTTSRLLADIIEASGRKVIHNRSGSNLIRGITTTLIKNYPIKSGTTGIFEVDEATLPLVLAQLTPDFLIINNLFRDQLDRYGEVNSIFEKWLTSIRSLDSKTTLILNSDDPHVAALGENTKCPAIYFGLDDKTQSTKIPPHTIDARVCPFCGQPLIYDFFYSAHLGSYRCPKRDFRKTDPEVKAKSINIKNINQSEFVINFKDTDLEISLPLSGLYNIYNSCAAAATAYSFGINSNAIKNGLENFEAAFGRGQLFNVSDKKISLNLVKNPVGYNEVLKLLAEGKNLNLFLILNDNLADGTDVSWIWDVDFESLKDKVASVTVSGTRCLDLANRLKYAGWQAKTQIEENIEKGFLQATSISEDTLFVLPTYTAMLKLQKILSKKGLVEKFWEN